MFTNQHHYSSPPQPKTSHRGHFQQEIRPQLQPELAWASSHFSSGDDDDDDNDGDGDYFD